MADKKASLTDRIDGDKGLRAKRHALSITAILLLLIEFSGATVIEANTLIFKLAFNHQEGIAMLLAIVTFVLLIRYYNYAMPYHEELFETWTARLLNQPFFFESHYPIDKLTGIVIDHMPFEFDLETENPDERINWTHHYVTLGILKRGIKYDWENRYDGSTKTVYLWPLLKTNDYLSMLWQELKEQLSSYVTHRENLDIYIPYVVGASAIIFYIFPNLILMLF